MRRRPGRRWVLLRSNLMTAVDFTVNGDYSCLIDSALDMWAFPTASAGKTFLLFAPSLLPHDF